MPYAIMARDIKYLNRLLYKLRSRRQVNLSYRTDSKCVSVEAMVIESVIIVVNASHNMFSEITILFSTFSALASWNA